MEGLVAQLLSKFERGQITRRKFAETLAMAATTLYGGSKVPASAAAPVSAADPSPVAGGRGTLRTLLVNHISYGCPDYRKPRDFYRDLMGMELVDKSDSGQQAILAFGPKGSTPD